MIPVELHVDRYYEFVQTETIDNEMMGEITGCILQQARSAGCDFFTARKTPALFLSNARKFAFTKDPWTPSDGIIFSSVTGKLGHAAFIRET
jgi:hypothetical protein